MIGSMKAYFAEGTPVLTLTDARDDLLFFIRTAMTSGEYESAEVRKVTYIEDLSTGAIHSNPPPNSQQVLVWQQNGAESSSVLTGVITAMSIVFVGLLAFLFISRRRKKRSETMQSFNPVHTEVEGGNEDVEVVWQKALNAYNDETAKDAVPPDLDTFPSSISSSAGLECEEFRTADPDIAAMVEVETRN